MAKKSKEIEFGGIRIQIDPLILLRRILTRQKLLLAAVAMLGGLITVGMYLRTPKKYTSFAEVVIRTENFQDDYLRKLLNVVARYLGSETEMMIIINELGLFESSRTGFPYELALRDLRRELKIDRPGSSIQISYQSKNPQEAQRVVAFVTERVMTKLADLKDSPYRQQLTAIRTGMDDVEPKLKEAQLKLFEFKDKHPEIAIKTYELLPLGSPTKGIQDEMDRTQKELARCFGGVVESSTKPRKRATTPTCARLKDAEAEREALLATLTPSHPSVMAVDAKIRDLSAGCDKEQAANVEMPAGDAPKATGASTTECVAATKAKLQRLADQKVQIEQGASKKPELERVWAQLNLETSSLDTELAAYNETLRHVSKERLLAANEFRDSFVLVDIPRVPEIPSYPDRNSFLGMGGAITFMVGALLALLREALRQTFADSHEVEEQTGIPVLSVIPNINQRS